VGVGEGVGHRGGPELGVGVGGVHRAQVSQQVRAAPGVRSVDEVGVAGVAVAHDGAGVAGQYVAGVDVGGGAAAGVHRGEELGARHVHVGQSALRASGGLIDVDHPDSGE